ncbi:hypothetical protein [Candidatus Cyanaurora vandensis]|nr:hypothetical protein [Candidatus Cyanaurora vandensis]
MTVKYDANGVEKWADRLNFTDASVDIPAALALDSAGNVVITGYT